MVESYIMVDPHARFFQNGRTQFGYAYSGPILDVGANEALQSITWSAKKFAARYESPTGGATE
jgi:radical S-adenosyl methionine domain-containing protein 2